MAWNSPSVEIETSALVAQLQNAGHTGVGVGAVRAESGGDGDFGRLVLGRDADAELHLSPRTAVGVDLRCMVGRGSTVLHQEWELTGYLEPKFMSKTR